jgi:LmbE family N-acetylglucosaminyl deacetylase
MTEHDAASRHIAGEGTPDASWQAWGGLRDLPAIDCATLVPPDRRAVIVAPHPDDEVLACGGLLQMLAAQGTHIVLVAVTDGAGSHPGSTVMTPEQLARLRPLETEAALRTLGLGDADAQQAGHAGQTSLATSTAAATSASSATGAAADRCAAAARALPAPHLLRAPHVLRARLSDGGVSASIDQLQTLLQQLLRAGDVVFTTWRQDGHPDHEACGLAAALAANACGATLIEMPVWTWHWAAPGDARLPWRRARRLDLGDAALQRKRAAVGCFASQLHDDPSTGLPAILPAHVLARLLHPYEIYFT